MKNTGRDLNTRISARRTGIIVSRTLLACFIAMFIMVFCGCDDSPSISDADRKDPKKFAEYVATEFSKGNFRPYEKYASFERKEKLKKEAARVKELRREGNSQVQTTVEQMGESFKKAGREYGKVISYGVYSMTPSDKYASSGREAMTVKYWVLREHFKLTDADRRWLCAPKDTDEECKKKRVMGHFRVVREHDGLWYID